MSYKHSIFDDICQTSLNSKNDFKNQSPPPEKMKLVSSYLFQIFFSCPYTTETKIYHIYDGETSM